MKKNMLATTVVIAAVSGIIGYYNQSPNQQLGALALAIVEALSSQEDTSGYSNTGPAEEKRCYGGGHRMVCRCINSHPCSGTDCY